MLDLQGFMKRRKGHAFPMNALPFQLRKKKISQSIWMTIFLVACFGAGIGWLNKRIKRLEHKNKTLGISLKTLERETSVLSSTKKVPISSRLASLPFGEETGIVLRVQEVNIRGVPAAYNPSLVKSAFGYDLFFRYDVVNPKLHYAPFSSQIGVVPLDSHFKQDKQEFKKIELQNEYTDDPRVLFVGNQLYLFYNKLNEINPKCRSMCVSQLDPQLYNVNYMTTLDLNLQWIEKNWSPFEYIGEDLQSRLFFEYKINPRKILELPNPQINEMKNITIPTQSAYLNLTWENKWGEIRGGTPASKIGDEYLGFFHSQFTDEKGLIWYVMGAYTFDARPPFHLTKISKYPILFNGIYESPLIHTAPVGKRVIFPAGFVIEKQDERDLIHLACGENDCNVKIITIQKEQLIKSMEKINAE